MPRVPAETVPALEMPPRKLEPVIEMAVWVPATLPLLSIRMPWLEPLMTPLSVIPPVTVPEDWMRMPVSPEIVPVLLLTMPPAMAPLLRLLPNMSMAAAPTRSCRRC